jgi:GNAT superfamily N-acetyltransferase
MIVSVDSAEDHSALRELLMEFHGWMAEHDDAYNPQNEFTEDLESLEGEPESWAWIARSEGTPAGCVLLYGETDSLAEFRRLWVRPAHRGTGMGRSLTQSVIEKARSQGYETLGLTTPPWADASHALYESMGFEKTPPYPGTRLPEKFHDKAIFMQLSLGYCSSDL